MSGDVASTGSEMSWHDANRDWLETALARLRRRLEAVAMDRRAAAAAPEAVPAWKHETPPALEALARRFGLSPFERDLLLLAAGPDLDPGFGAVCAAAQGEPRRSFPTFALALAALPEAHWSALAPNGPLRRWRLLEVGSGAGLTTASLSLDERVLHYLRGFDVPDDRLAGMVTVLGAAEELVPSHARLARRLAETWARPQGEPPVALLLGADAAGRRAVAAAACAQLGFAVQVLPAALLPTAPGDLDALARLLTREWHLGSRAVLVDASEPGSVSPSSGSPAEPARFDAVARFAESFHGPLLVALPERRRLGRRRVLPLEVDRPETAEQGELWRAVLGRGTAGNGAEDLDGTVGGLTAQFDLGMEAILAAGADALGRAAADGGAAALPAALWSACRAHARPEIETLAQRLRPAVGWDDLVLPEAEARMLREIAVHVRHRARVYEEWGFAQRSSRGLGISALFAGPSGTGKTMAAEVLAEELDLDLYRIDLASVVSKYIGETEKNLKRVFDAAESGGAILLFDEADALFGKRSEVKDSHDRYANIEVGYLLQRMEAYRGLAILTTNLKDSLDSAFLRRLRFVVRFPFPDAALRERIWRRVFPPKTPTAGLDFRRLARLGVAGGHIKNIAVAAAFRAAEEEVPVGMAQVLTAARGEYAKLEKPFTEKGLEVA